MQLLREIYGSTKSLSASCRTVFCQTRLILEDLRELIVGAYSNNGPKPGINPITLAETGLGFVHPSEICFEHIRKFGSQHLLACTCGSICRRVCKFHHNRIIPGFLSTILTAFLTLSIALPYVSNKLLAKWYWGASGPKHQSKAQLPPP